MALQFQSSPEEEMFTQEEFTGADFSTQPNKVEPNYSPETKNMVINEAGYVEKRTGTRRVFEAEAAVNGMFEHLCAQDETTYRFVHIGTSLYPYTLDAAGGMVLGEALLTGLADKKSRGFTFGGALYILGAGYIKIGYDDIAGALCYGFVKNASTLRDEETAPFIVRGRQRNAPNTGTSSPYCADHGQKKIEFEYGVYSFSSTPADRIYVVEAQFANRVRVAALYMERAHASGRSYFKVNQKHYTVGSDGRGLYIDLKRYSSDIEASFTCRPIVALEYDNFVYAPTMVTGRQCWGVDSVGGDVMNQSGVVISNYAPYTGEVLEGANLAAGLRKVEFYYKAGELASAAKGVRLFLSDSDGVVTSIAIDGVPISCYTGTGGEQDVYTYQARFADVSKYLFGARTEAVVTVTYLPNNSARDVIDNCSIYALYGGSNDTRVFVSGNEAYPARDFASGLFDASYFSDLGYTDVGAEESAIVGYHKLYGNLIIVKDGKGGDSAQYLRSFTLSEDGNGGVTPLFAVKQGNISYGAVCQSSFKSVGGVPLYVGKDGVFTIGGTNVENQNNTVSVSQRVDGRLLKEDLANAVCAAAGGRYYLFTKGRAYVCDVERAFAWYYFDGLPEARCAWTSGETLYLGTADGTVYRFMGAEEERAYYDDVAVDGSVENARAIEAVWELPQSVLGTYTNYKTVRNCYLTCMPQRRSSVKVYYNTNEDYQDWVLLENIDLFSFEDVDFGRFTFRTIAAPFVFATGVKAKNVYVFGLRLVNDAPGEPFGFLAVSVKYRIGKYVK